MCYPNIESSLKNHMLQPYIESATTLSDFEDIAKNTRFGYFGNGHSGTAQCVGIGITH